MDKDIVRHGAAFCIGVAAFAFGVPGAGLAMTLSGSAVTSVSFARFWNGRQELKQVERAQADCRDGYLDLARQDGGRADIDAMDSFLNGAMSAVEITREEMEELVHGGRFARGATDLLMVRMGVEASGHPELGKRYARDLIETGLQQAMRREAFLRTLQLEAVFSIQREVAGLRDKVDGLDAKIRNDVPRSLLESLVQRFEHDNPDAPVPELEAFLKDKAKEWQALKARLAALEAGDARLANVRAEAEAAIERADFDTARARLDEAAEIGTDAAVEALRKVAEIHALKAETWLFQGDADAAAECFETGAMLFTGVDRMREAEARQAACYRLYEHGKRFGGTGLLRAVDACRRNDAVWTREAHASRWAGTRNNLALVLEAQAARVNGKARTAMLAEAEAACRGALEIHTREEHALLRAGTQNSLAGVLVAKAETVEGTAAAPLLAEAVAAYAQAAEVYTFDEHPEHWAALQNNRAIALRTQARRVEGAAGEGLLAEAVAAYRLALDVLTREERAADWAMAQNNLGVALRAQAERVEGAAAAALLAEAVTAYRLALGVRTRKGSPSEWAVTHLNLGMALEAAGDEDTAERAERYRDALHNFEAALDEFGARHMGPDHATCSKCRDRVAAKLAAIT